jgi:HD-GYP domain-containing protein (c-di-GMP phosphodiesterase class II)
LARPARRFPSWKNLRPLIEQEDSVLRQHPELELQMLKGTEKIEPDMFDIALHHHEYIDGSGYPHGLSGREISDLVRVATICDVFGALLEPRTYKPPIRNDIAYQMLLDMGPKLDQDLIRVQFLRGAAAEGALMIGVPLRAGQIT